MRINESRGSTAKRAMTRACIAALPLLAALQYALPASAANLYWDLNGPTPGAGAAPSGTWDPSTANWSTDPVGNAATQIYLTPSTAVFAAGTDATGAYTITVNGTQTAAGLTVEEGDVTLSGGTVTLSSNTVDVATGATATFNSTFAGTVGLNKTGAGTLRLNSTNLYSGGTTISAGAIEVAGNAFPVGGLTINGGTLRTVAAIDPFAMAIVCGASGGTIDTNGFTSRFNNVIQGTGSLTKIGTGTLILTNNNAPAGGTIISAGTLQVGDGGTTGSLSGNITNNATLTFNRSNALLVGGAIGGTGAVIKEGAGNVSLIGNCTYSGGTTISAGILLIGTGGTTGSITGNIINNSALAFLRSDAVTYSGIISGPGNLSNSSAGTLVLTGANSYTGTTTITQGTVRIGVNDAVPAASAVSMSTGTTFDLNGFSDTIAQLSGQGSVLLGAGTLTTGGSNTFTFYSGVISGSGSLVKTGTETFLLSGANTYTGGTTISDGTLQIGGGGIVAAIAGNVLNNSSLVFNRSNTNTFAGAISGTGSVTQAGAGTLVLAGTNSYAGGTTVSAGTLRVVTDNSLPSGRAATVNDASVLTIADDGSNNVAPRIGALTVNGSGKVDVQNNKLIVTATPIGTWNGSEYTDVTGLIQDGRGDGSWNGGGIVTSMTDATSGTLTTLAVGTADELGYAGGTFGEVSVSSGDVLVMYTWGGDADLNGELNGDDYFYLDSKILAHQSSPQNPAHLGFHNGDFNYDGALNGDDYFILDSNILQAQASAPWPTGAGIAGLSAIPEPSSSVVLLAATVAGAARRRRKARST